MLTEEALQAGKPSSLRHRSRLKHEFMMQMDHILDDSLRMYQILLYTVQLIFPASWRSKFTSSQKMLEDTASGALFFSPQIYTGFPLKKKSNKKNTTHQNKKSQTLAILMERSFWNTLTSVLSVCFLTSPGIASRVQSALDRREHMRSLSFHKVDFLIRLVKCDLQFCFGRIH